MFKNLYKVFKNSFVSKIYVPLKIRILIIIVLPVFLYPLIIIYFNKYQEILIRSEFEAIERQGLTFSKVIGLAEDLYGFIEKKNISGKGLQSLLPLENENQILNAKLYNIDGELIANSEEGVYLSKVDIKKLPLVKEDFNFDKIIDIFISNLSKIVSQPIDLSKFNNGSIEDFKDTPPEIIEALNGNLRRVLRLDKNGNLILYVALPIRNVRVIRGAVLISSSSYKIEQELINLEKELFKTLGLILFATLGLGIYLVRSITNPIIKLSKMADYITENKIIKLDKLPDLPVYKDEIGKLSKSFSTMIRELQIRVDHIASFAADVAHELKNPLTSLRSASETLLTLKSKSDQKNIINIIQKDVKRMNRLISDISLSSKLDAELIRTEFRPVNIYNLLKTLIEIRTTSLNYNINFKSQFKNLIIKGNEDKIAQVCDNIINNSFSFANKNGKMKVQLKSRNNKIFLYFDDNGPGFPSMALKRVFDRFYTERPLYEEFGKHSGLGLSISKQIIEAHNGEIYVENIINSRKKVVGARVIIILKKH